MRSSEVARQAGISYRQLDYWCRAGYVGDRLRRDTPGEGCPRHFSPEETRRVRNLAALCRLGFELGRAVELLPVADRLLPAVASVIADLNEPPGAVSA